MKGFTGVLLTVACAQLVRGQTPTNPLEGCWDDTGRLRTELSRCVSPSPSGRTSSSSSDSSNANSTGNSGPTFWQLSPKPPSPRPPSPSPRGTTSPSPSPAYDDYDSVPSPSPEEPSPSPERSSPSPGRSRPSPSPATSPSPPASSPSPSAAPSPAPPSPSPEKQSPSPSPTASPSPAYDDDASEPTAAPVPAPAPGGPASGVTVMLGMVYNTSTPLTFSEEYQQQALLSAVESVLPDANDARDLSFVNASSMSLSQANITTASMSGRRRQLLQQQQSRGSVALDVNGLTEQEVRQAVEALERGIRDGQLVSAMQSNGLNSVSNVDALRYAVEGSSPVDVNVAPSPPPPPPTPTPPTPPPPQSNATPPPPPASDDGGISIGIIIGAAVGGCALLLLIAVLIAVFIARRRRRKGAKTAASAAVVASPSHRVPPSPSHVCALPLSDDEEAPSNNPFEDPAPVATPPLYQKRGPAPSSPSLVAASNAPVSYDNYRKAVLERQKSVPSPQSRQVLANSAGVEEAPRPPSANTLTAASNALSRVYSRPSTADSSSTSGRTAFSRAINTQRVATPDLPEITMTPSTGGEGVSDQPSAAAQDAALDEYYRNVLRTMSGVGK